MWCYLLSGILIFAQLSAPATQLTKSASIEGPHAIFSLQVVERGQLRIITQRVLAVPDDAAPKPTLPPGWDWEIAPGPSYGWRVTAVLSSETSGGDRVLWTKDMPGDPFEMNSFEVLDAALFEDTVVVLYRCGAIIEAEIATPKVMNYSLLSLHVPPPDQRGYRRPLGSHLINRGDLALMRPGSLRGKITGSISEGSLTVQLSGDRDSKLFRLTPEGQRYRWVPVDGTFTTQPATRSGSNG